MVDDQTIITGVGVATFGISVLGIVWRGFSKAITRWQRTEDKLDSIIEKVSELVKDKEKVHSELAQQMREDRNATNKRLRYLEEKVWEKRT